MKIITRWPNVKMHLRNIEIALKVAKGATYKNVSSEYNLSSSRVEQVYRVLMAKICEQKFDVDYMTAVYDKTWTRHKDAIFLIKEYRDHYINTMKWRKPEEFAGIIFYD